MLKERELYFEGDPAEEVEAKLQAFADKKKNLTPGEFLEWKASIEKENEDRLHVGRHLQEFVILRAACEHLRSIWSVVTLTVLCPMCGP